MSEGTQRRLAAIVAADVAGYSRLVGLDEEGTLATMRAYRREIIDPAIESHNGRIANTAGDSLLLEFSSAVDAVRCAIAIQSGLAECNTDLPIDEQMLMRVGINVGDVVADGSDLLGDGVNIAARLEGLAEPGGITLSDDAYRQVRDRLDIEWLDGGEHAVKNIARPVRVWRWATVNSPGSETVQETPDVLMLPNKPSIAVLPFDNMSGDAEQEYFVDGVVEDIITALARIPWIFVIARNSTFTYKGQAVDIQNVAKDLGVRYVVEGSVRRAANRVRITAQLIDSQTGSHLWAERYDREIEDIFALQDEITETIVGALEPEITHAEIERTKTKRPENLDAWDLCLRGRAQVNLYTKESVAEAVSLTGRAIELDPSLAPAYATLGLAFQRQLLLNYVENREAVRDSLIRTAARGVALDRQNVDCQSVLGLALWNKGDAEEALSVLHAAVEIGPSHAFAHSTLGLALGTSGQPEEGLNHHEIAIRLSPRDSQMALFLSRYANTCINAREYEKAFQLSQQALRISGGDLWLIFVEAATALVHLGRLEEANAMVDRMLVVRPDASVLAARNAFRFSDKEQENHYFDALSKTKLKDS